ncbi:MAG: endo alpha-1,4 polygalactosaminidase [Anaerolineae bacterium]
MFLADKLREGRWLLAERAKRASMGLLLLIALLVLVSCRPLPTPSPLASPVEIRPDGAIHAPGNWWHPPVGTSWQWQLTGLPVDLSLDVDMYDIDLFDNEANSMAALHAQGRKVICYVSVGSWEDWRPDADQVPASALGNDYEGWPGEKWLDIRQIDLLAPIMSARLERCKAKGFDGIEPDNMDGYANDTGFPLTYQDQLDYNLWLAQEAHARGLSIGLKNDDEQVADLLPYFDWVLTEDCFAQDWCDEVVPFIAAGKAVFAAEYTDQWSVNQFLSQVCPQAGMLGFSAVLKNRDLDAQWRACP